MEEENKITDLLQQYETPQSSTMTEIIGRIPTVTEIEQENLVLINGCSSNTAESDVCNDLSQLEITKKKRTRRKPRHKKLQSGTEDDCVQNESINSQASSPSDSEISLKITAITSQTSGKIIRIKNDGCRHIHINFYKNQNRGGAKINAASNSTSSPRGKVIGPNDTFCKDNSKSPVKDKHGTAKKRFSVTQLDNSNLQSSSLDLQCASASSSPKRKQRVKKVKKFQNVWSEYEIREGLLNGELIKGVIRINAKNFREAYVSNADRSLQDYVIQNVIDRNRALEGDVVAIQIKPKSEWTEKQKSAVVVCILEKVHSRYAVGFLQLMPDKNKKFAAFIPRDCRVPRIKVPMSGCPPSFHQNPHRYENLLFRAKIHLWREIKYAIGSIVEQVGVNGDLESETCAVLAEYNLDVSPFPPNVMTLVPFTDAIPAKEFEYREDLRSECIFTIDPLTARDLDDAVSCKELENGNLEIGVHISDVAHFLAEGTLLDKIVSRKATTIYLVNNVYHMLPQELCMLCSLLPGSDKRAFSVFWEMTKSGEVVSYRFARTVVNSCVQLAYEHAQLMIEDPNRTFEDGELPKIFGGFMYSDLSKIISHLQAIAVTLRAKRFESGALRIDQTKLLFRIDANSGEPTECFAYENKEAHRLIEEFMLLANITVAQKIAEDFPDLAFLRCHEPPNQHLLVELKRNLKSFGIDFDISSSKAMQSCLWDIRDNHNLGNSAMAVLHHLIAKPMTRARYFCAATTDTDEDYQHFALHVPIYTHFTSPIRRYADVMVHRLLAASLGYSVKPQWSVEYVSDVANNCNKQKYNAKCAGDASSDLYLAHYVAEHQPFVQAAVVVDVKNSSFDILIAATGSVVRMYPNNFDEGVLCVQGQDDSRRKFTVVFPETSDLPEEGYVIQLFSILKVNLYRKPKTNKLEAKLLRPISSQSFESQNGHLQSN